MRSWRSASTGARGLPPVLEYPELGMEAVWRIEVEDFPAFMSSTTKGHDFFAEL